VIPVNSVQSGGDRAAVTETYLKSAGEKGVPAHPRRRMSAPGPEPGFEIISSPAWRWGPTSIE
jgi:hypothetical protein